MSEKPYPIIVMWLWLIMQEWVLKIAFKIRCNSILFVSAGKLSSWASTTVPSVIQSGTHPMPRCLSIVVQLTIFLSEIALTDWHAPKLCPFKNDHGPRMSHRINTCASSLSWILIIFKSRLGDSLFSLAAMYPFMIKYLDSSLWLEWKAAGAGTQPDKGLFGTGEE